MSRTSEPPGPIENASLITEYFGFWPSFHDAEVMRVELIREAPSPKLVLDLNVIFNLDIDHSPEAICVKLVPCYGLSASSVAGR
jgi:hypothetical protein